MRYRAMMLAASMSVFQTEWLGSNPSSTTNKLSWAESQQGVLSRRFTVRLCARVPIMAIISIVERLSYTQLTMGRNHHRRRLISSKVERLVYIQRQTGRDTLIGHQFLDK